jgi:hypothetical protein
LAEKRGSLEGVRERGFIKRNASYGNKGREKILIMQVGVFSFEKNYYRARVAVGPSTL